MPSLTWEMRFRFIPPLELEVVFISMPTLPTEPRPLGHHHDPIATVQRLRIGRALSARLLFDDGLYTRTYSHAERANHQSANSD